MKTKLLLIAALLLAPFALLKPLYAQVQLNQVIVVSGGVYSNPNDIVTVWTLNPQNGQASQIDQIGTQAVQDAYVHENHLYVSATDSLVLYDLDSHQRIAAIEVVGLNQLFVSGELLFVSRQFPVEENFVHAYNRHTLEFVHAATEISDEAAGLLQHGNYIYVAVPGSWMSTTGSLAVLNAQTGTFVEEIAFGEQAIGIYNLFVYNDFVVTVNRSPWGVDTGSLSFYNTLDKSVNHYIFKHSIGKGIGLDGNMLYCFIDEGIGSINLDLLQVDNPSIVPDPGSANFVYFAAAAFDQLSNRFYATSTDYFSFGNGYIYDIGGELVSTFDTGVSSEAIALDYRDITSLPQLQGQKSLSVSPNPATSFIRVNTAQISGIVGYAVFCSHGKLLMQSSGSFEAGSSIKIDHLSPGIYQLRLTDINGNHYFSRFLKQ